MPDLVLIRCPTLDFLVVAMQILNQYRRIKIDTEHVFIPEGKNVINAVAGLLALFLYDGNIFLC